LGNYVVETEKLLDSIEGNSEHAASHCDIVIKGKGYFIFIEQKLLSPESGHSDSDVGQLKRYNMAIEDNPEFEGCKILKLFLTPRGVQPKGVDDWVVVT
jgi:hypothetical protein